MKRLKPAWVLAIFILLNLVLAVVIAPDYGLVTDENHEEGRANLALDVYLGKAPNDLTAAYDEMGSAKYYGTASTALTRFIEQIFFPNTELLVGAHFGYFVFFQVAVVGVFLLARRFLNDGISLGVALLFATQPLLFGHAFINPKDIPMLAVFMMTMVLGLKMVDGWAEKAQKEIASTDSWRRRLIWLGTLLVILVLLWSRNWVVEQVTAVVEDAYQAQGSGLLGKLFAAVTTGKALENYIHFTNEIIQKSYWWLTFSFFTPLMLLVLFYSAKRSSLFNGWIDLSLLAAGAMWGFAVSTRVIAFAAGGMIGLYALIRLREKAVLPLAVYTFTAGIAACITWPYFSIYGLPGLLESLTIFSKFPWNGTVLFAGKIYAQGEIPSQYLLQTMLLQFTEPLVLLSLAGMVVAFLWVLRKKENALQMGLLAAWFLIPMLVSIISRTTNYHNFRQYFFITPPLFIFAGVALQALLERIRQPVWKAAVVLLTLLPGLVDIVQLHPYQYVYYNAFAGGVSGAEGEYPMDYWNTGYKEAMGYINAHAIPGSKILVWKDNLLGKMYATEDFTFRAHTSVDAWDYGEFDYALMPAPQYREVPVLKDAEVVYTVDVDRVPLVVVLRIPHGEN